MEKKQLIKDIAKIINKHSLETELNNTPDFILAEMVVDFLENYKKTSENRNNLLGAFTSGDRYYAHKSKVIDLYEKLKDWYQ